MLIYSLYERKGDHFVRAYKAEEEYEMRMFMYLRAGGPNPDQTRSINLRAGGVEETGSWIIRAIWLWGSPG